MPVLCTCLVCAFMDVSQNPGPPVPDSHDKQCCQTSALGLCAEKNVVTVGLSPEKTEACSRSCSSKGDLVDKTEGKTTNWMQQGQNRLLP